MPRVRRQSPRLKIEGGLVVDRKLGQTLELTDETGEVLARVTVLHTRPVGCRLHIQAPDRVRILRVKEGEG